MTGQRTVLVIEDGTEYVDAFRRLADTDSVDFVRAGDREEAAAILKSRRVDAVFLDVVFDRTPPAKLVGDVEALVRRFGGDRARAERQLAENQGFHLLCELAPLISADAPVAIAYDFSAEPERLAALRANHARLSGVSDGTPISEVFRDLTSGGMRDDLP